MSNQNKKKKVNRNKNVLTSKQLSVYKASTKKNWRYTNTIKDCVDLGNRKLRILKCVTWALVVIFGALCCIFAGLTIFYRNDNLVYSMIYCLISFQILCLLTIIIAYIVQGRILKKAFETIDKVRKGRSN